MGSQYKLIFLEFCFISLFLGLNEDSFTHFVLGFVDCSLTSKIQKALHFVCRKVLADVIQIKVGLQSNISGSTLENRAILFTLERLRHANVYLSSFNSGSSHCFGVKNFKWVLPVSNFYIFFLMIFSLISGLELENWGVDVNALKEPDSHFFVGWNESEQEKWSQDRAANKALSSNKCRDLLFILHDNDHVQCFQGEGVLFRKVFGW